MNEEREHLIHEEEKLMGRIVDELLDDAENGNIQDISFLLGDIANYVSESAKVIKGFKTVGSLVVKVDPSMGNQFILLNNFEGDGVSALVFGPVTIGTYVGMSTRGISSELNEQTMRFSIIRRFPEIASSLKGEQR